MTTTITRTLPAWAMPAPVSRTDKLATLLAPYRGSLPASRAPRRSELSARLTAARIVRSL